MSHYAKVCKSKDRIAKQQNDRLNKQSARIRGHKKKSTNIHLVADHGEILETIHEENIPWLDTIDLNQESLNNTTDYTHKGFLEVHKTKIYQAFIKVEMFPTNWMVKSTGNKPMIIKCKLDTGAGVNAMPLSTYQHFNHSVFDKQGQPMGGYGQDRTILKRHNGKSMQQYSTGVIFSRQNN